jgi:predicted DNA-binding protein (MmcQ/YjbR family)
MNIESFREYCLSFPHVTEHLPFDEHTLVFKVGDRIFALCNITYFRSVNLKCDPERAVNLREEYSGIRPGWHMNKKHWNTVEMDGSVNDELVTELVRHSYDLVWNGLPRAMRAKLTR